MIKKINELFEKPSLSDIFSKKHKVKNIKYPTEYPKLSYLKFTIENFKGIEKVEIDLARNGLILLLGLNESGKTTILKGIEAFNFLNDPEKEFNPKFFQSVRRKSDVSSDKSAKITAEIQIEEDLWQLHTKRLGDKELSEQEMQNVNQFIHYLNEKKRISITREFPFKNGSPKLYSYKFQTDNPFKSNPLANILAHEIISVCPFIIYFEDFKDRIPEKIFINSNSDAYDPVWYDIIDGLFYNTNPAYSITNYKSFFRPSNPRLDDANTVLTLVNKTLNRTFTEKWKTLSGVKEIETTELTFNASKNQHFTLKIKDKDGTTYSVDERSKGALWYLSFLMKTEFRSKKLRKSSGKPVFLIDEPASNLHSTAQNNMINDFKALAQETSIIYTTHSQYLISLENIRNTYIIEKKNGTVEAKKWGSYLSEKTAQITYYQPLANLLDVIPNDFTIPWNKCLITEGPSDRHVLKGVYRLLYQGKPDFVIYPGTSANSLSPIISLNIGWNSNFKILLDSDKEGVSAAKNYKSSLGIDKEILFIPDENKKIEGCFSKKEKESLRKIVLDNDSTKPLSKKEFAAIWALIAEDNSMDAQLKKALSRTTLSIFTRVFDSIQ